MKGINQLINQAESLRVEVAERGPPEWNHALANIVFLATKMRSELDRVTAYMALPIDTTPEELALAVKLSVRRVQDLEKRCYELEERLKEQGTSDLERRVAALEARVIP